MPYVRALGTTSVTGSTPSSNIFETLNITSGITPPTTTKKEEEKKSSGGGFWSSLTSILGGGVQAYATTLAENKKQPMVQYVPQQSGMPSWLPYALIGGIGLVAIVALKKK